MAHCKAVIAIMVFICFTGQFRLSLSTWHILNKIRSGIQKADNFFHPHNTLSNNKEEFGKTQIESTTQPVYDIDIRFNKGDVTDNSLDAAVNSRGKRKAVATPANPKTSDGDEVIHFPGELLGQSTPETTTVELGNKYFIDVPDNCPKDHVLVGSRCRKKHN